MNIQPLLCDITTLKVDAIVNAANSPLQRGGGVCGAIFAAAGPELDEACYKLGGCEAGEVRITAGYNLPAKFIIHAVGPIWCGGHYNERKLLSRAYWNSMELADANGCKSIAFPAISTGIYGFPLVEATQIAVKTIREFSDTVSSIEEVIFSCFDQVTLDTYDKALLDYSFNLLRR